VARACNLELHALRLPAVVAPSSTRRSGLPGAPFLDAGEQRAARHRGIITVDQALLALSSLVARVAEGSGPCAPVTHVLEPTYRPDAVRIDALLAAEPEGEESPPRWPSHMTTPLMAHAPSGVPVATGIFADDLEVTLALAGPATGSIFRYRFVRADDGAALAVYDTDPAGTDRPAIVACNAFGMPAELLEPLARALAGRFRFITWQSRGVPVVCKVRPDELTIERQVQDLEAVLSHTRLQDCGLLGWCLGAQVALEAASRGAAVISSLVLLNGVFAYDEAPQTEWQKSLLKTTSYVLAAPDNAAKMCAFVYGAPKPRAANAPNAYAAATQRGDVVLGRMTSQPFRNAESLRRYAEFVTRAGQRQGCVDWDRLPPRTLFVAGHEDQVVTPQSIALASRRVPGARLLELPDTDHYGHYYEPERYAHLIEEIAAHDHRLQPAI
jgi:pimeloyl-ACP methyl ester carboxylesterase